jgi:hypothetical protein
VSEDYAAALRADNAAKRRAAYEAWKTRVNEVLMLHIGLIDEELCEQTARFLAAEAWLIDGKPELENRHVLLIAKVVGHENRRDGPGERRRVEIADRIDQVIGWAKDGAGEDWYRMDREKVDRMRDDILSYAFGEPAKEAGQ